jgi:hypothetical protein
VASRAAWQIRVDLRDEGETKLRELGLTEGESFSYQHDFGRTLIEGL